jgi:hypothetical protein
LQWPGFACLRVAALRARFRIDRTNFRAPETRAGSVEHLGLLCTMQQRTPRRLQGDRQSREGPGKRGRLRRPRVATRLVMNYRMGGLPARRRRHVRVGHRARALPTQWLDAHFPVSPFPTYPASHLARFPLSRGGGGHIRVPLGPFPIQPGWPDRCFQLRPAMESTRNPTEADGPGLGWLWASQRASWFLDSPPCFNSNRHDSIRCFYKCFYKVFLLASLRLGQYHSTVVAYSPVSYQ